MKQNNVLKILALFILLLVTIVISLSTGEINIPFIEVIKGVFGGSNDYFNNVLKEIRIPRTIVGVCVGATLSVSGYITSIALKNPLADSGILGIQSGASVGAMVALLVFPTLSSFVPVFAFVGGLVAFILLVLVASINGSFKPTRIVLIGVAINSICTSIIGIITVLNAEKIRNAITWLNGSIANITVKEMNIVSIYTVILLIIAIILMPIIKILLLDDRSIKNIGYRPYQLRIMMSFLAVVLASISVAFVGIISFAGIIAPQISKKIIKNDVGLNLIGSMFIGGVLVVGTDTIQRIIFSPMEIPVGILIGMIGAPVFLVLASGGKSFD